MLLRQGARGQALCTLLLSNCLFLSSLHLSGELGKAFNRVGAHRAGVESHDRERSVAHEEDVLLELVQVLEDFKEDDVLCEQDVVEGFDVLVAVLDRDAIAEADALGLMVLEPLGGLAVDEEPLVLGAVGLLGEGRKLVGAVDDDDRAWLHLRGAPLVEHGGCDVLIGLGVLDVHVDGAAEEGGQRELGH